MKRIAMFVFNDGNHDQRVHKQAQALGRAGYDVRVYCFLQRGQKLRDKRDGYLLVREDQRSRTARFFDDQIIAKISRRREEALPDIQVVSLPQDRKPKRPCSRPRRVLKPHATPGQKDHWAYIERINGVWAERAASWKPDLVQGHDLDALRAAVMLGKKLDIPVIYDSHELWSEQPFIDSQEAVRYWNDLETELIANADAVVTINEPLAEIIKDRYGLDEVMALHNTQKLQEIPDHADNEPPIALYQGAYVPHRGLEQVIAAAALTDAVQIAFRGFGACEREFRALDRAKRVQWLDPVPGPEVVQAASGADIGLIPFLPSCLNHYYSTPNKLFEYMSAGLAVAGSDIPEIARFVGEYEMGTLFDPYSPSDIANALERLANSTQLPAMKKRARLAAEERWNWETEIKAYLDLVGRLLD